VLGLRQRVEVAADSRARIFCSLGGLRCIAGRRAQRGIDCDREDGSREGRK
jgi:hypothetical protein